ncbi:MAG: hypothetical protein ABL982_15795 [Vicinamibacterales bacterium]
MNGRSYVIGELETPTLGELRQRALDTAMDGGGAFTVSNVSGDVGRMHQDSANGNALLQVASQFNLLEMTGPGVSPEDGVSPCSRPRGRRQPGRSRRELRSA